MKAITLPDELVREPSLSVGVFDYISNQEISKQHIVLNKNTISFLREGTKEVFSENSSFAIDNSQFLLMKSGKCLMTEKLSQTNNYRSILLFFSNEVISEFIRKFEIRTSKPKINQSIHAFEYDIFITRFVDSLLDITKFSKEIQHNILKIKFEELMLYLIESKGTDFLYPLITDPGNPSQKFIHTVERNKYNKLTLQELSFLCNMSISSFKREFKKHYLISPIKWFQNKRLEYAFHLIKDEQKRPSDIYSDVGYENLSSFIQAYKAKYGLTPKQHQNNLNF
ncbi:helix-turn-helix domain-containing protein [Aquimarina algicola]|uniref:Helix-turn-helix transcriptional regulator n=1 Tax=Aquimarina algicola TaxID=2589995 RepID=A0A504J2B4_9FLAO|nr:AraC family transcriptional regulator [Aquimarina algicola]TPN81209.1 helix-turn-helix transcriptional regulator [Aquimarina algicola]